ncbi:solute:sodium symporter family transporter [Vibrio parahaemolyticus]|uniref:solute:sodium symporter family transporter n=1 Tax=Vibrio TaxID=662 RepID=UPI000243BFCD|nr:MULTISPECIES: solute:sodium symporter family transporter [Vibrio]EJE4163912.1 solute:sodium symporter family transporter [Vibrio parahaemolyticus]AEX22314.1 putative transporter [Vibrio sp. EJY3]EJR0962198.1 solute:sodium symporter family transporter [Vibrio parahaemolyticus]QKE35869.1 solute:sodium symporter family transporter [Vibrio fluvialis]BDR13355.1 solute:sodium symporter family transporter [Vibrio sp. STUT-A11]
MSITVLLSFLLFTGFVVVFTYSKVRNDKHNSQDGFFLGGRSLTGGLIASSLILTNLSATSFVGMSAQSYTHNMSVMGWEVASGVTLVIIALLLVPRYLKQGITTIPDFLESRYDMSVKKFVTLLFLCQYVINILPTTLYAGAVVLGEIFDVQSLLGISEFSSIALISATIGLLGFFYAIYGGLKAVVIADTINGVGLITGGLMIPVFGLMALGGGNFMEGLDMLLTAAPEKLQSVGQETDPLPFSTLFTGLLLVNLYYWGTDQSIIQRALGAKNLKEGQKGVILAGAIKVISPLFLIIPGIIAFHMFGADAGNPDTMYTRLVNEVLPKPLVGFFVAVMFGAILSTFNGVLNSSTTLFALNVYKPLFGNDKSDEELVGKGRIFGVIIAVISVCIAPFILYAPEGLFQYLQMVAGFFSVPIFTIVFVGYISKRVPAIAAKVALTVFVSSYAAMQLIFDTPIHFLHQLAILFVVCTVLMFVIGHFMPRDTDYVMPVNESIDVTPWSFRFEASAVIIYMVLGAYVMFSDAGFVSNDPTIMHVYGFCGVILFFGVLSSYLLKRRSNDKITKLKDMYIP